MDVQLEVREANRRLKRSADRMAIIAAAKVNGMTPKEYADKLDRERLEKLRAMPSAAEQLGTIYRQINDAFVEFAENFARGWNGR